MFTFRLKISVVACLLVAACSSNLPTIDTSIPSYSGGMPADLSGSWERDYSRSDDIQGVLNSTLRQTYRSHPETGYPVATQDSSKLVALAKFAELITRPDVLTITQDEFEIKIARKDDFTMLCEFYEGYAQRTQSEFGGEVCSWNGHQLVSHLVLPDGLLVSHRFTVAANGMSLHVSTTIASSASRVPFTVNRVYMKFEPPESGFNCVETLSMNRVCSTGEITP